MKKKLKSDSPLRAASCSASFAVWYNARFGITVEHAERAQVCDLNVLREAFHVGRSWMPIDSAPKDGSEIIVYCPPAHGLNHMVSVCSYHEDAGFCVDELREPTLWIPLPND